MAGLFLQFAKPLFFIFCSGVLLYMIYKEVARYAMNEDASSISFKKFNASPRDKYPTFTLCFHGKNGETIWNNTLFQQPNKEISRYSKMITGKSNATKDEIRNLPNFSSVAINLKNMVKEFYSIDENSQKINRWILKKENSVPSLTNPLLSPNNSSSWPFYVSFQNPEKICFTRNVTYKKNEVKLKDIITLNSKLLDDLRGTGQLFVYVHYPQHTIRSFGEEVAFLLLAKKSGDLNKTLRIKISGVNVIRKRLDANIPCNIYAGDQDTYFREAVIEKVRCIPPYWKPFVNESSFVSSACESSDQLREAYFNSRHASVRNEVLNADSLPCTEMSVSSSIELKTNKSDLSLVFHYRAKQYMETITTRDYVLGDLLSGIGGFVGMFLGYGLFQVPEIIPALSHCLSWAIETKNNV